MRPSNFLTVLLAFTLLGISLTTSTPVHAQSQPQTEFQNLYFGFAQQGIRGQDRIDKFSQLSQDRVTAFLNEPIPASALSLQKIHKLYDTFVMSEAVGEGAPTALRLENKNSICYFRALWLHMYLLAMGTPDESIRKLVLEGNIKHPNTIGDDWAYHIVTAVKASDNQWYVLDAETQGVVTLQNWFDFYNSQPSAQYSENIFLFTAKPSHQFTLIDDHYDLSIIPTDDVERLMKWTYETDKIYATQLDNYLKNFKR